LLPKLTYNDDPINEYEMGGEYSTNGGKREMYTQFWAENLKEREHLENQGVDKGY
jgi:hypothetical protein